MEQSASSPFVDAVPLAELDDVDHWAPRAAQVRLSRLEPELPVPVSGAVLCSGQSNDVWDLGESVLRVCWQADRDRLIREARLLAELPAEVPHAKVHAVGRTAEVSWVLSERVSGIPLAEVAQDMPTASVRELCAQVAQVLAALHAWRPGLELRRRLAERPGLDPTEPLSMWAADLVPLPAGRALALVDLAKALPHVDSGLVDAAGDRIRFLADADPLGTDVGRYGVTHGDPTLGNWLVHDGRITALIDFEWARIGPPDLDLVLPILGFQPGATYWSGRMPPYLDWLKEDYPQLFAIDDLDRRLWLAELCFFLRGIIGWPPHEPEATLNPDHPLHSLRRVVDAPLPR